MMPVRFGNRTYELSTSFDAEMNHVDYTKKHAPGQGELFTLNCSQRAGGEGNGNAQRKAGVEHHKDGGQLAFEV